MCESCYNYCEQCGRLMIGEDTDYCKYCGEFARKGKSRWFWAS